MAFMKWYFITMMIHSATILYNKLTFCLRFILLWVNWFKYFNVWKWFTILKSMRIYAPVFIYNFFGNYTDYKKIGVHFKKSQSTVLILMTSWQLGSFDALGQMMSTYASQVQLADSCLCKSTYLKYWHISKLKRKKYF